MEFTDSKGDLATYTGEVIDNIPNGYGNAKGSFVFFGKTYQYDHKGLYKNGKAEGKGSATFTNNYEIKDAIWSNNYAISGTAIWPGFAWYKGEMLFNVCNSKGTYTMSINFDVPNCPDCRKYIGEWKMSLKSGMGNCYNADGILIYSGRFFEDKPTEKYPNRP